MTSCINLASLIKIKGSKLWESSLAHSLLILFLIKIISQLGDKAAPGSSCWLAPSRREGHRWWQIFIHLGWGKQGLGLTSLVRFELQHAAQQWRKWENNRDKNKPHSRLMEMYLAMTRTVCCLPDSCIQKKKRIEFCIGLMMVHTANKPFSNCLVNYDCPLLCCF